MRILAAMLVVAVAGSGCFFMPCAQQEVLWHEDGSHAALLRGARHATADTSVYTGPDEGLLDPFPGSPLLAKSRAAGNVSLQDVAWSSNGRFDLDSDVVRYDVEDEPMLRAEIHADTPIGEARGHAQALLELLYADPAWAATQAEALFQAEDPDYYGGIFRNRFQGYALPVPPATHLAQAFAQVEANAVAKADSSRLVVSSAPWSFTFLAPAVTVRENDGGEEWYLAVAANDDLVFWVNGRSGDMDPVHLQRKWDKEAPAIGLDGFDPPRSRCSAWRGAAA